MTKSTPVFKLLIFVLVTMLTGFGVATLVGNLRFGSTHTYSAVFSSASGIGSGADVRVAGVPMGKVTDVALNSDSTAVVTFSLSTERPLTSATEAKIKYKNLIGDRYVDLSQGAFDPRPLDGPIPLAQTTSALDLDQVVNGFRPLLQGLDPDQTNQLSTSLVQVLNGQESSISTLITQVDTLTNTLADRDQAIGQVITNFNTVLGTVNSRHDQFGALVDQLQHLVAGLNDDRGLISRSLGQIDDASKTLAEVLTENRPAIAQDVFVGIAQDFAVLGFDGKEPLDPFEIDIPERRLVARLKSANDNAHARTSRSAPRSAMRVPPRPRRTSRAS